MMPIGDHNLALAALQAVVLYAPLLAGPGRAVAFRVDGRPRRSRFTHFLLACWWSSAAQSGQFICCVRACVCSEEEEKINHFLASQLCLLVGGCKVVSS
jgi:hypothetical protein